MKKEIEDRLANTCLDMIDWLQEAESAFRGVRKFLTLMALIFVARSRAGVMLIHMDEFHPYFEQDLWAISKLPRKAQELCERWLYELRDYRHKLDDMPNRLKWNKRSKPYKGPLRISL